MDSSKLTVIPSESAMIFVASLLEEGHDLEAIARKSPSGLSVDMVINMMRSDEFKELMALRSDIATMRLKAKVVGRLENAFEVIERTMEIGMDRERLQAAKQLMSLHTELGKAMAPKSKGKKKPREIGGAVGALEAAFFDKGD